MSQSAHPRSEAFPPQAVHPEGHLIGSDNLEARLEPFDSFWQAPEDVEKGYARFAAYYLANYLPRIPPARESRILVISCGPGYLIKTLVDAGYHDVLGIDSFPEKIAHAKRKGLNCEVARAFEFLAESEGGWDCIIPEQEINHLTTAEQVAFLTLCRDRLKPGGSIIVYGLNGANPIVGAENIAHNIDHFNLLTEYSIAQLLKLSGFKDISVFPLKVYVFWKNPANYLGLFATRFLELVFRGLFKLYGKNVTVFSKKIAATARRAD
jgi:2-polyprenyl-3-methyl-5-hydroxy-6-metoxy-1,4-benzoquinol methylase